MTELIVIYIIGLIFCIVGRAIDIKINFMEDNGAVFFTLIFVISPISIPIIFAFGLVALIGFIINLISNKISELIS